MPVRSTSLEAYKATNAAKDAARILSHFQSGGNFTCEEMEKEISLKHQTCSARFTELKEAACIRETKERRETDSKRSAYVCELVPGATFERFLAWKSGTIPFEDFPSIVEEHIGPLDEVGEFGPKAIEIDFYASEGNLVLSLCAYHDHTFKWYSRVDQEQYPGPFEHFFDAYTRAQKCISALKLKDKTEPYIYYPPPPPGLSEEQKERQVKMDEVVAYLEGSQN